MGIKYEWYCEKTGKSSTTRLPCSECDKSCPNLIKVAPGRYISRQLRDAILSRDGACLRCGSKKKLTIDHITPLTLGGSNGYENLQTLCEHCNSLKSNKTANYMKFKIYQENQKWFIERLVFPRFKGEITFGEESDIENIEMLDECTDVAVLAKAMRAAGEFIIKGHQIDDTGSDQKNN